jgi:glutamine synthetase
VPSAAGYNYRTSFSPKVEAEGVGNGEHVRLSVWNLISGGDGPCGLTVGGSFAAGILNRLPALLAIGAPSVATYLRLVPSHCAGVRLLCLGNRKAALRLLPSQKLGNSGQPRRNADIPLFAFHLHER